VWTFRGVGLNVDDVRVCARARETSVLSWLGCAEGTRVVVKIGVLVETGFADAELFLK
jgi:hypothetical protein